MNATTISVHTGNRAVVADITEAAAEFAEGKGDGLLSVFALHATCGLALMETGSASEEDLLEALDRLLPRDDRYRHRHGAVGHGADHLIPAIVPPSLVIPVEAGLLVLGTWQRLVLVDPNRDNPDRRVRLTFVSP